MSRRRSPVCLVMMRKTILTLFLILSFTAVAENWEAVSARFADETNPQKAIAVLTQFIESVDNPQEKYSALVQLARLCDLLGHTEMAQAAYEQAFAALTNQPDFPMLLRSAALLIELNQWERAENQLDICLVRCQDESLLSSVHFSSAYLAFLKGDAAACAAHIQAVLDLNIRENHSTLNDFLPWIAFFSQKHPQEFQKILSVLKNSGYETEASFDFRLLSPVMMLSQQLAAPTADEAATDPPPEKQQPQKQRLIVAGSYSKKENADAVLEDLEMHGFSGKIKKVKSDGKEFYRIYVLPIENDCERTLAFLKTLDIAAFTVNDIY